MTKTNKTNTASPGGTTYIILDLEWNGAFSRRAKGYFNEIIEIGAVKMTDASGKPELVDTFHTVIRPVVSRKLSSLVVNLTGIEEEELEDGMSFPRAVSQLRKWIHDPHAVVMTWSTTDLMVLLENCRYFMHEDTIPFIHYYADLQAYCQKRMEYGTAQQLGLGKACELLGISSEDRELHRALDDSILSGEVFAGVYDVEAFAAEVRPANTEFYNRLTFKTSYVHDIRSPHVKKSDLVFQCDVCDCVLRRASDWRFRNRFFCAELVCQRCQKRFLARVQVRLKYDSTETRRQLMPCPEPEDNADAEPSPPDENHSPQE